MYGVIKYSSINIGMNVLSLFDGISCARVALGDKVKVYYASEIDPYAIKVAKKNYPSTIHVGDVTKIKKEDIKHPIDLLVGGSPSKIYPLQQRNERDLKGIGQNSSGSMSVF